MRRGTRGFRGREKDTSGGEGREEEAEGSSFVFPFYSLPAAGVGRRRAAGIMEISIRSTIIIFLCYRIMLVRPA